MAHAASSFQLSEHWMATTCFSCTAGSASQEDYMRKDDCILVDEQDNITGSGSKYDAHRFNSAQPRGLLHRAFSVFLFNEDNHLLLQQRARSKITFPGVWTNTCCSHQLHGYDPAEVDDAQQLQTGSVMGAKVSNVIHGVKATSDSLGSAACKIPLSRIRLPFPGCAACSSEEVAARAGHSCFTAIS